MRQRRLESMMLPSSSLIVKMRKKLRKLQPDAIDASVFATLFAEVEAVALFGSEY